jgi:hypothetical protein
MCGIEFWVCRSCDRGQVYCCVACRREGRRRTARAARSRHRRSEEGRLDHREHQRAYRARVRDHGSGNLTARAEETASDDEVPDARNGDAAATDLAPGGSVHAAAAAGPGADVAAAAASAALAHALARWHGGPIDVVLSAADPCFSEVWTDALCAVPERYLRVRFVLDRAVEERG